VAGRPRARRRLLVLGAGAAQLGLLEAARARGDLEVIAVDRDPQAVGFALVDERAVLSSEDEEAVDRLARARDVDGIVSPGADWPVGIAARVAERIGLPHPIDGRTGSLATSKARQRDAFAEAVVPHARAFDPRDPELPLPCVVKAADRQGQRGLTLVRRRDELERALDTALGESRSGVVLAEEYVEGPEVTVNAVSLDGRFVPLSVTDRLTADPPAFGVALAHAWPSVHDVGPTVSVARAAVEALGIRNGPTYTQLRLSSGGPVVMEVAARLGGGHDADLCAVATGVDLNALAVDFALGSIPAGSVPAGSVPAGSVPDRGLTPVTLAGSGLGHASRGTDPLGVSPRGPGGAAVVFLVPPVGRLESVDGVDGAEAVPGVEWVRLYRRPGHVFGPLRRGADRAGAVLATGSDREQALERGRRAADAVRFRVDADAS
jgi:biotin carboxylase